MDASEVLAAVEAAKQATADLETELHAAYDKMQETRDPADIAAYRAFQVAWAAVQPPAPAPGPGDAVATPDVIAAKTATPEPGGESA